MKLKILFLSLTICFCMRQVKGQANVQDSLVLVDFYNQTNGPGWINSSGWLNGPVSGWYGVKLDGSERVSSISFLSLNNFKGSIPASLGNLSNLTTLWINDGISGSIPNSLGNLSNLTILVLQNCQLSGSIPASLGNLLNLTTLTLVQNQLSGSIPASLGNLSKLTDLSLGTNQLSGSIPASLGNLSNLTALFLDQNQLSGSIPASLGNLSNLNLLELFSNQFSGSIPSSLGDLANLTDLVLSQNQLSGYIPASLGNLKNLNKLILNQNQLSGTIPNLSNLTHLTSLTLQQNEFTFSGMEGIAKLFSPNVVTYTPQDTIKITKKDALLSVSAGGTPPNNTYKWYKNSQLDSTKVGDSTYVAKGIGKYSVVVTNSIATQLTLYSDTVNGTLNVSLINPLPSMIDTTTGNLLTDVTKINMNSVVKGTSTDGVSKILLVANSTVPITYSLNGSGDGTLSTLVAPNADSTKLTVQPINGLAVAVYTPPDGYGTTTPPNESITINAKDSNNDTTSVNIKLVTPPVLLIHGMWSKPQQWVDDNFYSYLFTNGFQKNLYLVDYSQYNANTFDPLNNNPNTGSKPARDAINKEVQQAIQNGAANGIIVTQVDVVGHSLGGLQARGFSQDSRFLNPTANYNKGYFHKLITIGTPHLGSEWGPLLYYSNYYIASLPLLDPKVKIGAIAVEDLLLYTTGHPIGSCHLDFDPAFKMDGTGLKNLTTTTLFKVHTVEAQYDTPGAVVTPFGWSTFLGILSKIELGSALNESLNNILKGNASDVVVPQYSQLGGLQSSTLNDHYNYTTHSPIFFLSSDNTETNNPLIQQRVSNLLLTNDSSLFTTGFPAPNSISTPFDNFSNNPLNRIAANLANSHLSLGKQESSRARINANTGQIIKSTASTTNYSLQITSPTSATSLKNNGTDSLTLTLQFTNPGALATSLFMVQGVGFFTIPNTAPYSTKIALPKTVTAGNLKIAALASDTSGNLYADTLGITIQSSDTLKSITVGPSPIQLDSLTRTQNLSVNGLFTNGQDTIYRDITSAATGTQYSTQLNNTIASVTSNGQVNGVKAGTDTIVITNQNITHKIPVSVNPDLLQAVKFANSITLNLTDQILGNPPFVLNGAATSGDPITYNLISGPVNLANGIVTINGTGLVKIVANSPGDAYFNATPNDTVTFNILQFPLPVTNFKITITGATCNGSNDGSINISASDSFNYTATITGNGLNLSYPFTNTLNINNLSAGSYSVCITIAGQSDFQQCYNVVITQPQALSVYAAVNNSNNTVNLALSGGTLYNIQLNGELYTTTGNSITLPLKTGNNDLVISTDKLCQGTVEKLINASGIISPYPVPFDNILNLNLGDVNINNVTVEIHDAQDGKLVFSNQYVNQSGVLQLNLSSLNSGVYALHLTLDSSEKIFKILKQ